LPAGVTYDAAAQAFTLNAGASAYQHLGLGQTALVSVAYGVSDGTVTTSASVSWTVTGTNDGPMAVNDTGAVNEDASVTLNVLANDTDVDDGDSKTITAVGATALGGHVTLVGGQLVYAADADLFDHLTPGQSLTDSFTYTMKDAAGLTSTATATVTVRGVADGADLIGGNKTQVLTGTTLDEYIAGGNADDTLYGVDGADKLHGGNGKDLLYGGQGQDLLFGENGADVLDGGIGNDTLSGGNGPDTFVFGANFGADVVTDFDNTDTLKFVGGYTTAAQVLSHASQHGADVLIVSGADSILLKGVALSSLSAGDFLFG
jgi:VCBS repeat-containing protein